MREDGKLRNKLDVFLLNLYCLRKAQNIWQSFEQARLRLPNM